MEKKLKAALAAGTMPPKPEGWDETSEKPVEETPSMDMLEPAGFIDELTDEDKISFSQMGKKHISHTSGFGWSNIIKR